MMMKLLGAALAAMILAGCATAPSYEEMAAADYGRDMSQDECEAAAHEVLRMSLKDPMSAQIEFGACARQGLPSVPIMGLPKQYGWFITANVNAKNSFGGYVGYQRYGFLMYNGTVVRRLHEDPELGGAAVPF